MKIFYILSFVMLFFSTLNSQNPSSKTGSLILQLEPQKAVNNLTTTINEKHPLLDLNVTTAIKELNIWELTFDTTILQTNSLLTILRKQSGVKYVQTNRLLEYRKLPDDPELIKQWQYYNVGDNQALLDKDIDAPEAWDITTGGTTLDGQEIVVAVIDGGINLNHPDFEDNIWINTLEIPNNGIDDDRNGYPDDVYGWNFRQENNDVTNGQVGHFHGTPVAGIVGAKGNNGIGVTGVNWNVKIMNIVGGGYEVDALKAYHYVLSMRKRYNETNGKEGAFVVATNASWGINYGQAAEAPLWCEVYNQLGEAGILNAAATANIDIDVEIEGDLPTTCQSDYLITVTNTTKTDAKFTDAGYGHKSIDLAAPGAQTFTSKNTGAYGYFGGTSAATPHVAGAIALLYSVPSQRLVENIQTNPAQTALLMKNFILAGTDPLEDLKDITVTGGRLNLYKSILQLQKYYNIPLHIDSLDNDIHIQRIYPNPATDLLTIQFELATDALLFAVFYNSIGQKVKQVSFGQKNDGNHHPTTEGNHEKRIDISDLNTGIYYLAIRHHNRPIKATKLIIQH